MMKDEFFDLSHYYEQVLHLWMGLQSQYDLDIAEDRLGKRLDREVRSLAMAG